MTPDEYRQRLHDLGLDRYADALVAQQASSIRLHPTAAQTDLPIGATKLGGEPDLPEGFAWPQSKHVPQAFVAQINVADVAALDSERLLPPSGLLSFFYDAEQGAWGFDPADHGSWLVRYTPADTPLRRTPAPADLSPHDRYQPVALTPTRELTFVPWESFTVEQLGMTFDERLRYADVVPAHEGVIHRLLGHPEHVQGDMQAECQLVSHGISVGTPRYRDDPRTPLLLPGASAWRLLLQIDSDDAAGMLWGDAGRIYYWLRHDDLVARRFDQSWLVFQCY